MRIQKWLFMIVQGVVIKPLKNNIFGIIYKENKSVYRLIVMFL